MRRAVAAALLSAAAALPAPAPAGPAAPAAPADEFDLFKSRETAVRAQEAAYLKEFQGRFSEAQRLFGQPPRDAYSDPSLPQDATYDYAPFHALYADFVALQESRAQAAVSLAASGHPKALPTLFSMLLDACRRADAADAELAGNMPFIGRSMCDLRPGLQRHGLDRYLALLVPALAQCPGAAEHLVEDGWKKAVQQDGRKSFLRRVAVVDAVARCTGTGVLPFLKERLADEGDAIRIAALEALVPRGPDATADLLPLLQDPCPAVRFAVLDAVAAEERPDVLWISGLLGAFHAAEGRYRAGVHAALRRLTRQEIGGDPEAWMRWYGSHAAAIQDRTFDAAKIPVERGGGDPPAPGFSFYGVPSPSRSAAFLLQADGVLHLPVEIAVLTTQHPRRWPDRPKKSWFDPPLVHMGLLLRELRGSLEGAPKDAHAGLLVLNGKNEATPFQDRLVPVVKPAVDAAGKWLEGQVLAGWCGPYEGLVAALDLAGQEAAGEAGRRRGETADTIFLVADGTPRGGRYVGAEPVLAAFRRMHRFHRVAVHAIRIANEKDEAEALMRGLAGISGGTYAWIEKPPE